MDFSHIPALKQQWVLDATWTNCPLEVKQDIQALWRFHELGNDNYMLRRSISDLLELNDQGFEVEHWDDTLYAEKKIGWHKIPLRVDNLIRYLKDSGLKEDEQVILHYWW